MKSRRSTPGLASSSGPEQGGPGAGSSASGRGGVRQPHGNAALAEQLATQASQQGEGTEVAMGRGQAAGMMAGFGMAAANALGTGGLPAMLNPSGYWDTMPERPRTELVQPGAAAHLKPAN